MTDYEATAYLSLEKLKTRHQKELEDLHSTVEKSQIKYSKKVHDLRKRVSVLTHQWNYDEADEYKKVLDEVEAKEKDQKLREMWKNLLKKERKLK